MEVSVRSGGGEGGDERVKRREAYEHDVLDIVEGHSSC